MMNENSRALKNIGDAYVNMRKRSLKEGPDWVEDNVIGGYGGNVIGPNRPVGNLGTDVKNGIKGAGPAAAGITGGGGGTGGGGNPPEIDAVLDAIYTYYGQAVQPYGPAPAYLDFDGDGIVGGGDLGYILAAGYSPNLNPNWVGESYVNMRKKSLKEAGGIGVMDYEMPDYGGGGPIQQYSPPARPDATPTDPSWWSEFWQWLNDYLEQDIEDHYRANERLRRLRSSP